MYMLFFINYTATTEIYTLSLHDALPILLWYRQSVAEAAGLDMTQPVTWDQLVTAAQEQGKLLSAQGRRAESLVVWLNALDRKSTRLNSSHATISYAVFCLKKKKNVYSTI